MRTWHLQEQQQQQGSVQGQQPDDAGTAASARRDSPGRRLASGAKSSPRVNGAEAYGTTLHQQLSQAAMDAMEELTAQERAVLIDLDAHSMCISFNALPPSVDDMFQCGGWRDVRAGATSAWRGWLGWPAAAATGLGSARQRCVACPGCWMQATA
jgi:hypothetical protein